MQAGREIKFQVWDQDAKKMWTWEDINIADKEGVMYFLDMLQQDQFIPRQFTGHRDKNEREIYEKDIWLPQGSDTPRVIVWHRYGWWFKYPNGGVTRPVESTEDGEIIGNIYENPGLLQTAG